MSTRDNQKPTSSRYAQAGVSIERGRAAVEAIKRLADATRRPEVREGIGGFAGSFALGDREILAGADGVGSKLLVAKHLGIFNTIGIDLVAMNVNDVLAAGGEPLFFLDYIAIGYLHPERVRDLVEGMAQGCQMAGCALLGGETAEMPDLYPDGHFDLSGFVVGQRVYTPPSPPQPGDLILGLASTGFHSNGYQLIRRVIEARGQDLREPLEALQGRSLGEVLLTPTRIYVRAVRELWEEVPVRALAHITGGGLIDNLPRTLGGLGAILDWESWPRPAEMQLIQDWGSISDQELAQTFNCGIGFTVVLNPHDCERAQTLLSRHGVDTYVIGRVQAVSGVEWTS